MHWSTSSAPSSFVSQGAPRAPPLHCKITILLQNRAQNRHFWYMNSYKKLNATNWMQRIECNEFNATNPSVLSSCSVEKHTLCGSHSSRHPAAGETSVVFSAVNGGTSSQSMMASQVSQWWYSAPGATHPGRSAKHSRLHPPPLQNPSF